MNRLKFNCILASLHVLAMSFGFLTGQANAAPFVYETDSEFLMTGDFNGDGITDIALVERNKGWVQYGYGLGNGRFNWVMARSAGHFTGVAGVAVGKFIDAKSDSLALASANDNLVALFGWKGGETTNIPVMLPADSIGPQLVFPAGDRSPDRNSLDDLLVFTIYNADPTPNRVGLFRNNGGQFTPIGGGQTGFDGHTGKRLALTRDGKEYAVAISEDGQACRLIVRTLDTDAKGVILEIPNIATESDYLVGNFRGGPMRELVFYKSGDPSITVCPLLETNGKFKAGEMKTFTLSSPISHLIAVDGVKKDRLLAVFGAANTAELMDFDAKSAPVTSQMLFGYEDRFLSAAAALPEGVVLFSLEHALTNQFYASRLLHNADAYQAFQLKSDGSYVPVSRGLIGREYSTVYPIYERIVTSQTEKAEADMKAYTNSIPGTYREYEMVPIPGGEFLMGSPATEQKHNNDEGPQHRVKISPFWMGKYEVMWQQYLEFVYGEDEIQLREKYSTPAEVFAISDAVSRPSKPYIDMSFGMGMKSKSGKGYPAIAMTQHAANKFCQWLSAKTGHFYRLPTEAEWEYAARAGSTNAYFFGDDPAELTKYAWFQINSEGSGNLNYSYQRVGKKLRNPWGLYDIYGNVAEWVLDQYDESFYKSSAEQGVVSNPWNKAVKPYPHSVRGGSYDDESDRLRSAARFKSSPNWKASDTSLPKSVWWIVDRTTVGFRIVRPLKIPSPEEMAKYWFSGVEKD